MLIPVNRSLLWWAAEWRICAKKMPWAQKNSTLNGTLTHGLHGFDPTYSKIVTPLWGCMGLIQHALK